MFVLCKYIYIPTVASVNKLLKLQNFCHHHVAIVIFKFTPIITTFQVLFFNIAGSKPKKIMQLGWEFFKSVLGSMVFNTDEAGFAVTDISMSKSRIGMMVGFYTERSGI